MHHIGYGGCVQFIIGLIFIIAILYWIGWLIYWPFLHLFHHNAPAALVLFILFSLATFFKLRQKVLQDRRLRSEEISKQQAIQAVANAPFGRKKPLLADSIGKNVMEKRTQRSEFS